MYKRIPSLETGQRCGTTSYQNIAGVFSTPNYPMDYHNNMDCNYTFEFPGFGSHNVYFDACACELEHCPQCDYFVFGEHGSRHSGYLTGSSFAGKVFGVVENRWGIYGCIAIDICLRAYPGLFHDHHTDAIVVSSSPAQPGFLTDYT